MFIQLEHGESIDENEIIGVFDIETAGRGECARGLFKRKEGDLGVVSLCSDLPRSFLLCDNEFGDRLYITGLSTESVKKRSGREIV